MEVLVSDLIYKSNRDIALHMFIYDVCNRKIVGYSADKNKGVNLVSKAISKINHKLKQIRLFHTDRGKQFDNHLMDAVLETFKINRSLSTKIVLMTTQSQKQP
ncbi:DDE-type integrase/transposase/recombinase [Staphylococcus delphini]|uniref:DDE-type integrase/transposase/recombinase n=1 Tax=Staphylococcus delphini TaxID=53344 RepID=UPI000BBC8608|nr:DDE-type integrase/transposase/recombinase [Staphylococcus delphini]PCF43035.1 hypothetical protein B5C06_04725 [Staphylococcus delphini]